MQSQVIVTKKIQSVLIGCVLVMLYRGSSGYEAGDACNNVEHAPHSSDCTKFYHCEYDVFVEKICPSDLHFNAEILICDWPENANCQLTMVTVTTEQTTTETTPETTTEEIPTEQTTDDMLSETTEWLTITTENDISVTPTQFITETTQPSTSEITTEALTEIPEHYTTELTTEIENETSESSTEATEYRTTEFVTESTDLTTVESTITEVTTTNPQQTTTETTPETTTEEIPTEETTDDTLSETTEWFFTEITQPSTSEITTEALTEIPEHYTTELTTEIETETSESSTEATEYRTTEFVTESTDLTTEVSTITEVTTTQQTPTTAEPFDEFGACLEYTTGSNYGYTDYLNISDIGKHQTDYIELKVFVKTARNAHIMLTANRSESGLEIVNYNNEGYMIKQKSSTIGKASRYNLLNVNEYVPFIIRIFEKRIEVQLVGERKPFLHATVKNPINVTLISFGTASNTIGKWLYGCQVNPAPPTWSPNEPANSCERLPSGVFLRLSDYNSSPNYENMELKIYVATSAETVTVQLSSADYSPSGSPYYDIAIGKIHQIWRCNGLIANKTGSINLFQNTQLVPILITVTLAGRIQVTVNDESKTILNVIDPYAIDVQYLNFIAAGDILSVWYHGDCKS